MTFAPTKKTSKSRTNRRTTNWIKLTAKKLKNRVQFQYEWNEAVWLSHFAKIDWTYNWRQVYKVRTKSKNVTRV